MGYHNDTQLVALLNSGKPQVLEPQLPELMEKHQENLSFSAELIPAIIPWAAASSYPVVPLI